MKVNRKIFIYIAVVVAFITTVSFVKDYFEVSRQLELFASAYSEVNRFYVDETKPGDLLKKGISGMLKNLDPYTVYYPESEIEDYRIKHVGSEYGGIGASSFKRGDSIVIADVYEGLPAAKAGLRIGDVLTEVNNRTIKGLAPDEIDDLIKGQSGTTLQLRLERVGEPAPITLTITRGEIKSKNVSYYGMINDSVGYIKLDKFLQGCYDEMREAVDSLKKNSGMKSLVFDLRGNGGGLVEQCVQILNLFVAKNNQVVLQQGKISGATAKYITTSEPVLGAIPMAILIDRSSASASEITAGNFQDLDRGVIVGQRSFGKGLVQQTRPLSYGTQLKVTVAKYYTASGRCVQALNYASRHDDGSVDHVPDSLMKEFKTKNGRSVFDGSGVYPDRFIEPVRYSNITQSLISNFLIFDFASYYRSQHEAIALPGKFSLTDADYAAFIQFVKQRNYDYSNQSEKVFAQLKEASKEEKYYDNLKTELDKIENLLRHDKEEDLLKFKSEIKQLLEQEIIVRYYYEDGRFRYNFINDKVLTDALTVLANPVLYNSILKGDGAYKVIGKPKKN